MTDKLNFKLIRHNDIDSEKWNQCIDKASNCRIYAYDWHLDRTAEIWHALVWGDYEYVMPLPFRKKLGINYLYQPIYSQQLGIFPTPKPEVAKAFFNFITANYRYSDVQINSENVPLENSEIIHFLPRKNFLLSLQNDYKTLSSAFSTNTKRNISKANKNGLVLAEGIRLEEYLHFKLANLQADIGNKELGKLKSLIAYGQYKGFGKIVGVYTPENQLCAAVYFCRWKDRIIYFNAASSPAGKELRGMYFLVNKFLEKKAGSNVTLDFEGSVIPGVARFYSGFGASAENYFQLKFNRLPLPLKWIKRN